MKCKIPFLALFIALNAFAMTAPPTCSELGQKQRQEGYRFLPGVMGLTTILGTAFAISGVEKGRDGKAFSTDVKMFLMGVTGTTIGILSVLSPEPNCVVGEKNLRRHLPDLTKEEALQHRKGQRKLILKNLAISSGYMGLLSVLTKGERNRNAIYVLGGISLAMAGFQSLFINDKDLDQVTSVTLLSEEGRLVPGIAWNMAF